TLDPNLPDIYCDAAQIGRVITNLVINAIKFCGEGGHVTIWSKADDDASQVVIGVTDDGPGIYPDKLQHLFRRFEQVGTNARASAKGVGLGLSIAQELVSLNFGKIAVESEPGKGSTFSFTLPTADAVGLLERCLQQPSCRGPALQNVSLLTVEIDSQPSTSPLPDDTIAEIDLLLNDELRRTDLILPVAPTKWLLVLQTEKDECMTIARRIETARDEANRNRPTGMLPRLIADYRGTWQTVTERDELLASFQEEMRTTQEASV
ncbi:MAG TPA: ATP-binding protein, partial [Thermoguttaceae bacterium]|nr:ATP-binding protein [Thermoguttaceae bacterium]